MVAERFYTPLSCTTQSLTPRQLSTSPGFWEALLRVITSDKSDNQHKQVAAILLKNTIPKRWDDASHPPDEKIAGGYHERSPCACHRSHPAAQSTRLPAVRASLVAAAVTQPGNFLSAFAVAFSHIVYADFPARWPDLTAIMVSHLESGMPSQQIAAATLLHAVSMRTASKPCAIVYSNPLLLLAVVRLQVSKRFTYRPPSALAPMCLLVDALFPAMLKVQGCGAASALPCPCEIPPHESLYPNHFARRLQVGQALILSSEADAGPRPTPLEAGCLAHQILKCFYTVTQVGRMVLPSDCASSISRCLVPRQSKLAFYPAVADPEALEAWCSLCRDVLILRLPEPGEAGAYAGMPVALDDRPNWPWWRAKKWAAKVFARLSRSYSVYQARFSSDATVPCSAPLTSHARLQSDIEEGIDRRAHKAAWSSFGSKLVPPAVAAALQLLQEWGGDDRHRYLPDVLLVNIW